MTEPLHVTAILEAKPGKEEQLSALLQASLPTFQAEPGCLAYSLLIDTENAARFVTFEKWQDESALQAHMNSAAMAQAKPVLETILAKPMLQIKLQALPGSTV